LRRANKPSETIEKYQFGDIALDFKRGQASKAGEPMDLSSREFQLLQYFIEHRGEVITREKLLDDIWSYNAPLTRTVDMHIAKLRRKIEDAPDNPRFVITIHRTGYKFCG